MSRAEYLLACRPALPACRQQLWREGPLVERNATMRPITVRFGVEELDSGTLH